MKHTKLALVMVLLCGMFSACKQEAPAPAADAAAPDAMQPAATTPDAAPADATPADATPADAMPADSMPADATTTPPADDAGDVDAPQSGGDRVGTGSGSGG